MITGSLKSLTDRIWEAFWTGGISNPLTVIEQFTYLLFIRQLDRQQQLAEQKAQLLGTEVENAIYTDDQQGLRWHTLQNLDPETLYARFTSADNESGTTVFEHMKSVGNTGGVFAEYMRGATFMIPTPRLLDQVVRMIDQIEMDDRDTKGDLYEYLLSKIATAGTNGQFRTPRHIIEMMVAMVQPQPTDTVCDPSAGTAGFLVATGEYFQAEERRSLMHDAEFRKHFAEAMFSGIEFDPTMLRIGAMNLQLHGIDTPRLIGRDALSQQNDLREAFSLILANPPFKGSLDYGDVEPSLIATVKTKKTELLFLALILRMLKIGGRCAVIVPDGVLFGSSRAHKKLRQTLVEGHKLDAVVSMPSGVFKPYAGVSTAILFFTKTGTGGTDHVWYYDMQSDGYSLDDKRRPLDESDIPDIVHRYHHREAEADRARTEQSFMVPLADIVANDYDLSINRYKEIIYEPIAYDPPATIIADIRRLDAERAVLLAELEKEV